jgi:hypothetical protein
MSKHLLVNTSDWREAQRQEKERSAQASAGKLTTSGQQFTRFFEATDRFLHECVARLAPRNVQTEKERAKPLKKYFSITPLTQIEPIAFVTQNRKTEPEIS